MTTKRAAKKRAATNIAPKVKVPAIIGTIISFVVGVLTLAISSFPAYAFWFTLGVTVLTLAGGYLTYED